MPIFYLKNTLFVYLRKVKKLMNAEIIEKLKYLSNWMIYDDTLHRNLEFKDFQDCIKAINRIAVECERLNHHPEWTNSHNTLAIRLTTHDKGGVTSLDLELASAINKIYNEAKKD